MKPINSDMAFATTVSVMLFAAGAGLISLAFQNPHRVEQDGKIENKNNEFKVFHVGPHIGFDGKLRIGPGLGIGLGGF